MNELQYVIDRFGEVFAEDAGRKIFLHGTREYASEIIRRYDDIFHFAGVMTLEDTEADSYCGKKIYTPADTEVQSADMIILTERVRHAEEAWQTLRELSQRNSIRVVNMYGVDEAEVHREYEELQDRSLRDWRKLINTHRAVVFELLDVYFVHESEDSDVYTVRDDAVQMIRRMALKRGRDVLFSVRKSYPLEKQLELLVQAGIARNRDDALSQVIIREGEDLSFRSLSEKYGGSVLYICSGLVNEFILPRGYGIDTVRYHADYSKNSMTFYDAVHRMIEREQKDSMSAGFDREEICRQIDGHEVISFDLFDTLLVRRTLYPRDVYELTEQKTGVQGYAKMRIQAEEASCGGDIHRIKELLAEIMCIPEEESQRLIEAEMETEREVLLVREDVRGLFEHARMQGKRIVITSDMYMTPPMLAQLLQEHGICGYEKIFVSCACGVSKTSGLFDRVREYAGTDSILHIGDDMHADIESAGIFGIDACLVPSVRDMAAASGWDMVMILAQSLAERCLVGLCVSEIFGKTTISQDERFAAGACVPVILCYLLWLQNVLPASGCERILFQARDGYILTDLYEMLRKKDPGLPAGQYFHTGRHAAFLPVCAGMKNIALLPETEPPMTLKEVLHGFYDIPAEDMGNTDMELAEWLSMHREYMEKRQTEALQASLAYFAGSGLQQGHTYALMDFFASGTTENLLKQYVPFTLKGYYFGYHLFSSEDTERAYCFGPEHEQIRMKYIEMEKIMTSPEPSLRTYTEEGIPVFQKEVRSDKEINRVMDMQEVIRRICMMYLEMFAQPGWMIDPDLAEEMYAASGSRDILKGVYDDWGQFTYR